MTIIAYGFAFAAFYAAGVFTSHWWRDTAVPAVEGEVSALKQDLADLLRKHGL